MGSKKQKICKISLSKIKVMQGHRPVDKGKVRSIAESMKRVGLRTPITVVKRKKGILLVAGAHRADAARLLGWKKIDCVYFKGTNEKARTWRLVENFHRADLTALQRAELSEEWRKILQKKKSARDQKHDKGFNKAAKATGLSRETIRRANLIQGMSSEAKVEAQRLGLDDNQQALLTVAKQASPGLQVKKAKELAELKKSSPRIRPKSPKDELLAAGLKTNSSKAAKEYVALNKAWKRAEAFRTVWKQSHKKIRTRFFEDIMMG